LSAVTAIHGLVERCRAGQLPNAVGRLHAGWLILGEQQVLSGYCLLLPDPVVAHLNDFDGGARSRFMADMALAGDVLLSTLDALRINYALYGNVEPALHAHLFPRYAQEPAEQRTLQPFALDWQAAPRYEASVHGELQRKLRAQLAVRGALRRA
jgi:diadenosine tetraphosphate (Ap4A) HIT family hydrolase